MVDKSKFSKYNQKETGQSIYCYEGTNILKNKLGIKNAKALEKFEADITLIRQSELENEDVVNGRFGITHIKNIHRYIFQDVYPFAGKFRTENISKGSTEFCKSQYIEANLKSLLNGLKDENFLEGMKLKQFSQRAAYYLAEINIVHPFREGNGRCIREFIRQLARKCGFTIDWSLIDGEKLLEATIVSVDKNYIPLTECVYQIVVNK